MDASEGRSPRPVLFVSPHLDDAVLSAGALMRQLARQRPVVVVTVFTAGTDGPHGRAARRFLASCAMPDANDLFTARQREDVEVVSELGGSVRHLGEVDALFRRRDWADHRVGRRVAGLAPDLAQRYPTYRLDIARGRVARSDRGVVRRVRQSLRAIVDDLEPETVLGPLGIGLHTDHVITRDAMLSVRPDAVLWADQPYLDRDSAWPDSALFAGRPRWTWSEGLGEKARAVEGYRTQVPALFTHGVVPMLEERYFGQRPW